MNEFTFEKIEIGQEAIFERSFTEKEIFSFSQLTGDLNPMHVDPKYTKQTEYGGVIVHGMLVASLFSTLVGMYLPGKYCVYLSQDIKFRRPVKPNEKVKVRGRVKNKIDSLRILEIETEILNEFGEVAINGEAMVKVLK